MYTLSTLWGQMIDTRRQSEERRPLNKYSFITERERERSALERGKNFRDPLAERSKLFNEEKTRSAAAPLASYSAALLSIPLDNIKLSFHRSGGRSLFYLLTPARAEPR